MRLLITLILAVCLLIGGTIAAVACENDPYDFPFYSAPYAAEPDTDWVPNNLVQLDTNLEFVPASIALQR
jgi:hypothetical protein